jgi:hypothetical protein
MPVDEGATTIEIADAVAGEIYCVKYLYNNDAARKLVVNANFTPDTLSVYLTANLYSGDATNPTTGTKIGTVTIKVPRFLLSGSQELSMSMTGASNTAFEGSALASKGKGCDNDGIYAEIIEVINERSFSDLVALVIEGQYEGLQVEKGEEIDLKIYGRFEDTAPALIPESKVDITPDGTIVLKADGVIKAGETDGKGTITVKVGSLEQKIDVTVGTGEPAGE